MADTPLKRLAAMGLSLPDLPAAAGKYLPYTQTGNLVFTSGQLPLSGGKLHSTGLLGQDLDVEQGQEAAKHCALNVLAQLNAAAGSLDNIAKIIKITVFVASHPNFTEQHLVANGASGLIGDVLGADVGTHARSAVGMSSLPLNAPVEVEAIAALKS